MATTTARSDRSIPMPAPVVAALRTHRERQRAERSKLGDAAQSQFVFTTELGTPIHPRNDCRSFQQLLKRSGLRKARLHELRHTAASLLPAQGVQISITLNTYTHVDTTLTRTAADRMEEAL